MNSIPYPLQAQDPKGRTMQLFTVNYQDADGEQHSVHIYAVDRFHASLMVDDLKRTATLGSDIVGLYQE